MATQHSSVSSIRRFRNLWFLGFPKYRVGRDGSVWTKCKNKWGTTKEWKLKKPTPYGKDRRLIVQLHQGGKNKMFLVHRLILLAFVGPCPVGMEACHNDGNPLNNRVENLRWDTRQSNRNDMVLHGTTNRGEQHPMTNLTDATALKIKRAKGNDLEIAQRFEVTAARVKYIRGAGWKHLNHLA